MRSIRFSLLLLAACGGSGADSASPGNVGFGGAQDIGEFRGILDRGEIPGPSTLDANGFFNEHFNAPPEVTCGGPLCLTPGLAIGRDFVTGAHQATLQISINTTVDPMDFPRLPMNLVVVVDHSGSMAQDQRLEKLRPGLHQLIDNLGAEDRLALISFDDVVTMDAPFGTNRTDLHAAVDRLQPRGGTNIFGGLEAGMRLLGDVPESEKQNRVIFLSDGLATVGNTSQPAIIDMATSHITKGIGLTTIGVGNDFDVALMRGLAERGAGNFYYIEDAAAANEVFTEELDFFMQPLAMDVRIDAIAAQGWDMREVSGSSLWGAGPRQGSMNIPAVFFASRTSQAGEQGRRGGGSMIFIHMEPTTRAAGQVANLTLSYRLADSAEQFTHQVELTYDRDPTEALETPHLSFTQMAERYAMYNMFLGLKLASTQAQGDYDCAAQTLIATRANAVAWNAAHEDPDLAADLVLVDQFLANLRGLGAQSERAGDFCPGSDYPYPTGDDYYPGYDDHQMACSSGGGASGWLALLGVVGVVVIRRRRRDTRAA